MQRAVGEVPRDHALTRAIVVHHEIDGEVFDKEFGVVLERLLIQRVQDGMTGAVGRCASALGNAFAVIGGHATKRALVNVAILSTGKWHAVVFEFDHRRNGLAAHVLDSVLVA